MKKSQRPAVMGIATVFAILFLLLISASGLSLLALGTQHQQDRSHYYYSNAVGSSESLSFGLYGQVVFAGAQNYTIKQSGPFASASVDGLNLTSGTIDYALQATVQGTNTSGLASFNIQGNLSAQGVSMSVTSGNVPIMGMIAGACLPNYDNPDPLTGACWSNDTSAVPVFFVGYASNVRVNISNGTSFSLPASEMMFESAYSNPFGNPIVIMSSPNPSLVIVTPYSLGTVSWSNVVDVGSINGTLGSEPVTGSFSYNASETEDLVSGKAIDWGIMAFYRTMQGSSPFNALDVTGTYSGNSTIPSSGMKDCSNEIGFPSGSGVCYETGFNSTGSYTLSGPLTTLVGTYSSTWTIPAFAFYGASIANMLPIDPPAQSIPVVEANVVWYPPSSYQGMQYLYPVSVALNGVQFSSTFYESLTPQYQLIRGTPFAGYYAGTFEAVSGCQPGANITITATINGASESASGVCPSAGASSLPISLVFGDPATDS